MPRHRHRRHRRWCCDIRKIAKTYAGIQSHEFKKPFAPVNYWLSICRLLAASNKHITNTHAPTTINMFARMNDSPDIFYCTQYGIWKLAFGVIRVCNYSPPHTHSLTARITWSCVQTVYEVPTRKNILYRIKSASGGDGTRRLSDGNCVWLSLMSRQSGEHQAYGNQNNCGESVLLWLMFFVFPSLRWLHVEPARQQWWSDPFANLSPKETKNEFDVHGTRAATLACISTGIRPPHSHIWMKYFGQ